MSIKWTQNFAYAIGLFTADGCLSSDGRHLEFNSKDKEQVLNFVKCLGLTNKIGRKAREKGKIKKYYRVEFGNKKLYNFLCLIGLKPKKSLTLKKIDIPINFFSDFIRGLFDGDGNFNIFWHPESQYPQTRFRICSASPQFLRWLHLKLKSILNTRGFISKGKGVEILEYAKKDSLKILKYIYYSDVVCLSRKFKKITPYLRADVAKLAYA